MVGGSGAYRVSVGVPPFLLAPAGSALERRGSSLLLVMGDPSQVRAAPRPLSEALIEV